MMLPQYLDSAKRVSRRLAHLIMRFGVRGLGLYAGLIATRYSAPGRVHVLHAPGLGRISVRSGTSDSNAFFHVIVHDEYRLPWAWDSLGDLYGDIYQKILDRGGVPLILDCGANVGFASLWFARRFPKAIVYAVEPDKDNYAILCENARNCSNIVPLLGGIWDHKTSLMIADAHAAADCMQVVEGTSADSVPAYTIADLMAKAHAQEIMVAKIDIEGAEETLFKSNVEWLRATDFVAIELHDSHFPGRAVSRNFFAALGADSFDVAFKDTVAFCRRVAAVTPSSASQVVQRAAV
jgi:FkbM family methyltransferase